jgi:hypothetical protein
MELERSKKTKEGLKLNGSYKLLVYTDDRNLLGGNVNVIQKTEIGTSKEAGLEVSTKQIKYVFMPHL